MIITTIRKNFAPLKPFESNQNYLYQIANKTTLFLNKFHSICNFSIIFFYIFGKPDFWIKFSSCILKEQRSLFAIAIRFCWTFYCIIYKTRKTSKGCWDKIGSYPLYPTQLKPDWFSAGAAERNLAARGLNDVALLRWNKFIESCNWKSC